MENLNMKNYQQTTPLIFVLLVASLTVSGTQAFQLGAENANYLASAIRGLHTGFIQGLYKNKTF